MPFRRDRCPRCGTTAIPIAWGDLAEPVPGHYSGGCSVYEGIDWHCDACYLKFGDRHLLVNGEIWPRPRV